MVPRAEASDKSVAMQRDGLHEALFQQNNQNIFKIFKKCQTTSHLAGGTQDGNGDETHQVLPA
jgi:hypothetical protein